MDTHRICSVRSCAVLTIVSCSKHSNKSTHVNLYSSVAFYACCFFCSGAMVSVIRISNPNIPWSRLIQGFWKMYVRMYAWVETDSSESTVRMCVRVCCACMHLYVCQIDGKHECCSMHVFEYFVTFM